MKIKIKDFIPSHTFDCGQCFRWEKEEGESYVGVAGGKAVRIKEQDGNIEISSSEKEYSLFWENYLDAKRDYSIIKKQIEINPVMKEAISFGAGIHLLRQEFHEALVSFIISQRSSIPKIKSCVSKLCEFYGEKINFEDKTLYAFPDVDALSSIGEEDYRKLGVGYRAPYIVDAVKRMKSGELDADFLLKCDTQAARKKLMEVKGVGDKVCDCVLLFSLGKYDLFPSDVWIKRVMLESFDSPDAKSSGEGLFGEYSGFAQQYLFYWRKFQKEARK